jgi:hypothetical protein
LGAGAGLLDGPFRPPKRLLAIFCLALSSGAMSFFFYLGGGSIVKAGNFTSLVSYEVGKGAGFSSFFSYFLNKNKFYSLRKVSNELAAC